MANFKMAAGLAMTAMVFGVMAPRVSAQQPLKLFDAHMHYNQEPNLFYSVDRVLETFRRNNVAGILSTSRPNKGTHQLVAASKAGKAPGLWIVPFIRPYRVRADIQTWFKDEAIWQLIQDEYRRGYYRGIGEFHIYGKAAASPLVKRMVDFAVAHDLFLHAHCDEEALLILFGHNAKARIIWAHTGFSTDAKRVGELMVQFPALMGELSYRGGITGGDGKLTPEWHELFARHSDRFLIGSDTWINERWAGYDAIMKDYRGWLAQLPPDQAKNIAYANAERLFGGKVGE